MGHMEQLQESAEMRPLLVQPLIRMDKAGDGTFGAPRGGRSHRGVDYLCEPGRFTFSPVNGTITKLGYCYVNDPKWRYVEVTCDKGRRHRMFYCLPLVRDGELITKGQIIGENQNIPERYPDQGMKAHIHYEIIEDGDYLNPEEL